MRIVYLIESAAGLWGGVRSVLEDASRLHQRGHDVLVLSRSEAPDWMEVGCEFRTVESFDRSTIPDADVVIGTFWTTVRAAVEARRGAPVHYCQGYEGAGATSADVREQIEGVYGIRAAHKVTIAPHLAATLAEQFEQEIHEVRYAVDPVNLFPAAASNPRPNGRVRVGLVGPWQIHWKGIETGIQACELARRSGLDVELVRITNTAPAPEELRRDVPIEWHERVPPAAMGELYRDLDVMLCTSIGSEEGFFLPAIEAMACGVPCVLTDIPCFRDHERFGRRDYALFVDAGDAAQMAEAIVLAGGHAGLREQLRDAGLDIARHYQPEIHVEELERTLDAVRARYTDTPIEVAPRPRVEDFSRAPQGAEAPKDLVAALRERADLLLSQGDHAAAAAHLQASLCLRPGDVELLEALGCAQFLAGRHDEALEAFDQVLAGNPNCASALERRGLTLVAMERFSQAVEAFLAATRQPSATAETFNNLGVAMFECGDVAGARLAFESALLRDPSHTEAQDNLAAVPGSVASQP